MAAPFKIPAPTPPAGVPLELTASTPTLFTPFTVRGITFPNRIFVAPMCTYSASSGHLTPFHLSHLSAFALRGAALTIIEATAVQPRGRISPSCPGLWSDAHIAGIRAVADLVHSQGHKLGIQLAHAGRKASTLPPWEAEKLVGRGTSVVATPAQGGWAHDVWGPSAQPYGPGCPDTVHEMSVAEIAEVVAAFAAAARRAVEAGVDVIEIHGAHGYLLSSFLSPLSNTRGDAYGGADFENRVRMLKEVCLAIRAAIPDTTPLFLRVSSTEWYPGGWDVEDTIRLAKLLPGWGVDLLDVSSGGNMRGQKIDMMHNGFQVGIAGRIRAALHGEGITELAIGAVGLIKKAERAREIVQLATPAEEAEARLAQLKVADGAAGEGALHIDTESGGRTQADVVLVARQFLREPEWVLKVAQQLGVEVAWPVQYARARWAKGEVV